mgnify:CR=1 FL=1
MNAKQLLSAAAAALLDRNGNQIGEPMAGSLDEAELRAWIEAARDPAVS